MVAIAGLDNYIKQELREQLLSRVKFNLKRVIPNIKAELRQRINRCPVFQQLRTNKDIVSQVGLVNAGHILNEISSYIADDIEYDIVLGGQTYLFGLEIKMVERSYRRFTDKFLAFFTSENGFNIEWLKNLLLNKGKALYQPFRYLFVPGRTEPYSRTNRGIMVKGQPNFWTVPNEVAGERDNNFITDVLYDESFTIFLQFMMRELLEA